MWAGILGLSMGFGALVYPATQVLYSYSQGTFNSRRHHTFILHPHNVRHLAPQMEGIPVNMPGVIYFNLLRTLRFFFASDTGEQYNFVENPLPVWGTAFLVLGLLLLVWRSLKRDVFSIYILVVALLTLTASTRMIEANFSPHLILFTLISPGMCSFGFQAVLKAVCVRGVALTSLVTVCVMLVWTHWNWVYYNKMMDPYRNSIIRDSRFRFCTWSRSRSGRSRRGRVLADRVFAKASNYIGFF
jgi:hypothetical protein